MGNGDFPSIWCHDFTQVRLCPLVLPFSRVLLIRRTSSPSAANANGFIERSRVERGHFVGPRIFQVGDVIYGAGDPGYRQDIADMDEARSALIRIKVEGGPISTSYKNYNQPSRQAFSILSLLQLADGYYFKCISAATLTGGVQSEHAVCPRRRYEL